MHDKAEESRRPKEIDLEKRVMLFLFARLMNKSKGVEELLELFELLFGFKVSYNIERLYSDEEVKMALLLDFGTMFSQSGRNNFVPIPLRWKTF